MLQETVSVYFGEGNSTVNAAWEYGKCNHKHITDKACSDLCFDNVSHTSVIKFCLVALDA